MNVTIRPGQSTDAESCGIICYEAFKNIAGQHQFPADFPNAETAIGLMNFLLNEATIFSVVAEVEGQIAGSNFLWEHKLIAGVGPITIEPGLQNATAGRKLMEQVLNRAEEKQMAGVRLVQAAYHNRSLSLYTKLGFEVKEPLAVMQGPALHISLPGYNVRPATVADLDSCNRLCYQVHGLDRRQELLAGIHSGTAKVVECNGSITGYTSLLGFFGHTVAVTNTDLKALIGATESFAGPGFLLPSRNADLMRWCLQHGLRIVQPMTLMSKGLYNEPQGAFLPSVVY